VIALIVRMVRENPSWSRRRIASELAKLGHFVSKDTVAKYMPGSKPRARPPSQTWGAFVRNHLRGTLAIDFLTVPTATFGVLYVFFVLSLERRRILHVNVTSSPYAAWTAQQMIEAVAPDVVAEGPPGERSRGLATATSWRCRRSRAPPPILASGLIQLRNEYFTTTLSVRANRATVLRFRRERARKKGPGRGARAAYEGTGQAGA
jgi:hypothetical protein